MVVGEGFGGHGWVVGFFMCGVLMYVTVAARVHSLVCTHGVRALRRGKQDMYYLNSKRDISIQKPNGDFFARGALDLNLGGGGGRTRINTNGRYYNLPQI